MDIERLTKSQIVLLTLLVSFVTSIATGIVTVSLMDQAPPAIAQSVSRIVEHTIEKVTPAGQAASVVTTEKTVVVKESDLVSQAVEKISPSLVRLYTTGSENVNFISLGVVLNASGMIAADADALGDMADAVAVQPDGTKVRAFVTSRDTDAGIAYMTPATSTTEGKATSWTPASVSATHTSLGQSIVMIAGKSTPRVGEGIVTALMPPAGGPTQVIETDISGSSIIPGSPLINTDGNIVGVSTGVSRASSQSGFISAAALMKPLDKAEKK